MSKKSKPFLAHSEITDCIYIIDGNDKYEVTEQCIKAMKATNRMSNVLDKIRTEIEALPKTYPFVNHQDMYVKEDDVLKILDKYMAEGSDKE